VIARAGRSPAWEMSFELGGGCPLLVVEARRSDVVGARSE
jgi:hypothetical protein